MILRSEISRCAKEWGVPPTTVDKDYVLGHFLSVFYEYYGDDLAFKGGTCLRKCYFADYRFSEDLDFSSLKSSFKLNAALLNEICLHLYKETGILFHPETIKDLKSKNVHKGYQVKIGYWGADHPKGKKPPVRSQWNNKIKLEISTEELCLLPFEERKIYHRYSDKCAGKGNISCYSIHEIISEKLRALVQRSYSAPRDIYDLYYLTKTYGSKEWKQIKPLFLEKMKHKKLKYTGPDQLINTNSVKIISKAWDASIAHQISDLEVSKDEQIRSVNEKLHKYM